MGTKIYNEHYLRHLSRVGLATLASFEVLKTKVAEYQWKVDHGAPVVSPEQIQMYKSEIKRLTPLLKRLEQVV